MYDVYRVDTTPCVYEEVIPRDSAQYRHYTVPNLRTIHNHIDLFPIEIPLQFDSNEQPVQQIACDSEQDCPRSWERQSEHAPWHAPN